MDDGCDQGSDRRRSRRRQACRSRLAAGSARLSAVRWDAGVSRPLPGRAPPRSGPCPGGWGPGHGAWGHGRGWRSRRRPRTARRGRCLRLPERRRVRAAWPAGRPSRPSAWRARLRRRGRRSRALRGDATRGARGDWLGGVGGHEILPWWGAGGGGGAARWWDIERVSSLGRPRGPRTAIAPVRSSRSGPAGLVHPVWSTRSGPAVRSPGCGEGALGPSPHPGPPTVDW